MRIKAVIFAVSALLWLQTAAGAVPAPEIATARETDAASWEAEETAHKIWEYEMAQTDVSDYEEYLRVGLVPYAGTGAEWLFISLKQWRPELDCTEYKKALDEYLEENNNLKAVDYQRIALAKSAVGADSEWITKIIRESAGQGGIMSNIYGLILADSGDYIPRGERLELAEELVRLQFDDGGFALNGKYSDTDVTAMALQALAPYKNEYEDEIGRALSRLSDLQRSDGGFASYGVENAESCAQVLMALCALNIDYRKDERFIKNSNTVWDAVKEYECGDGGYSHTKGGMTNKMATAQVLAAAVCLDKYLEDGSFLYDFHKNGSGGEPESPTVSNGTVADETEAATATESPDETVTSSEKFLPGKGFFGKITGKAIKIILIFVIAVCALTVLAVSAARRRLSKSKALWIAVPAALLIAAAAFSRIETRNEHYGSLYVNGEVRTYISITGCDGELLSRREIMNENGGSVFEQLQRALAAEKINLDYGGSAAFGNIYVRGIGGLSEFDYGSLSGWTYRVNGDYPNKSCASFVLFEGDYVEWIYTKDGGKEDGSE